MQRHAASHAIADMATGVVLLLAYLLVTPIRLIWRPLAAKRWHRRLQNEMEARPEDRVKVFNRAGELLGWGLREQVDRTHIAYAIPFSWRRQAATVRDASDREIRGASFHFGKSAWLLERRSV